MKTLKELRGIVIAVLFWTTQHWIAVSNVKCRDMPESTKGCFGFFFFKKALEHTAIGEGDRENLSVPSARLLPANHCHNYKRNSPSTHAALKISMGRKKYSLNPLWWAMLKGYPKWKKKRIFSMKNVYRKTGDCCCSSPYNHTYRVVALTYIFISIELLLCGVKCYRYPDKLWRARADESGHSKLGNKRLPVLPDCKLLKKKTGKNFKKNKRVLVNAAFFRVI